MVGVEGAAVPRALGRRAGRSGHVPGPGRARRRRAARDLSRALARAGEPHAAHWAAKLAELGEPTPDPGRHRRGARVRLVAWLARRFRAPAVLPILARAELADGG